MGEGNHLVSKSDSAIPVKALCRYPKSYPSFLDFSFIGMTFMLLEKILLKSN